MADLTLEQRIAFAAIQYDRARCDAQRLERERGEMWCDRSEGEPERRHPEQFIPCWKNYHDTYDGDRELDPKSTWCFRCQRRQALHAEYHKAAVKRGARLRELHRLCELAGGWQIAPDIKLLALTDGLSPAAVDPVDGSDHELTTRA